MKLWSDSWANGDRIDARYAAGRLNDMGGVTFSDNLNPHLAWSEVPAGTQSLVLICHDFDVPSRGDDVNQPDREVPSDLPRVDFFHWVLVDLPPTLTRLAEGEFSRGFTAHGKPGPDAPLGTRQGLNDYTGWFADDPAMAGNYFVHHYVFTLYATSLARLPLEGIFTGAQVRQAIAGHVLEAATHSGTYTLNRRLLG
jgi:phosphatidylethanolamine-binding protein (PEBP) family uncharacterized protein